MQFGGQPTPWSEVEIEGLRLRSVSQILIQEIGAAGPENAEESARRACGVIQRMADQIVSADARIAELEQSVTVRDTEIARLETDLELARMDAGTVRYLARLRFGYAPGDYWNVCIPCSARFIGDKRATTCMECADAAIKTDTEARAGNGGGA